MKFRERTTATLLAILIIVSMAFVAPIAATVEDGIVGLWDFDEGTGSIAYDSSGYHNDGTVIGATYVDGKFGKALKFDGINNGVLVQDSSSLDISAAITIEAWIYLESYINPRGETTQAVAEKAHAYYLNIQSGKLSFYWYGLSIPGYHISPNMIPLNTWIHVAGTYDGAYVKLYVDWVEVYSLAVTGTGQTSNYDLGIGYEPYYTPAHGQRAFQGIIDDVYIRDFALVPVEVEIDIKPNSDPNSVNFGANGLLPVAILGSVTFDVTQIDLGVPIALGDADLATRGPAKAPKLACSYEDVNDDGFTDLMTFFPVVDLVLTVDTDLTLTARLLDGTPIEGTDSVRVVPPP